MSTLQVSYLDGGGGGARRGGGAHKKSGGPAKWIGERRGGGYKDTRAISKYGGGRFFLAGFSEGRKEEEKGI